MAADQPGMRCVEGPKIRQLLDGELAPRETRRTLDHVRGCAACRDALGFFGSTAPTASPDPEQGPRYRRVSWAEVEAARGAAPAGRTRGFMAMAMVVILTFAAVTLTRSRQSPTVTVGVQVQAALEGGQPWPVAPAGDLRSWPRNLVVHLPVATEEVLVEIWAGPALVFSRRFHAGQAGTFFDAVELRGRDHPFPALTCHAPFPPRGEVDLPEGRPLLLRARTPSGTEGPGLRFVLPPGS